MIVRRLDELSGTEREINAPTWVSRRLLLASDGMGFSFHETVLHAGTETRMWYKNHLEAVLCIGGEGSLEDLETGEIHPITAGTMYALNKHDRHILRAKSDLRMICVFNPPCTGNETHDEDGSYPLIKEPAETAALDGV
jgi:L-ectoine synthase